MRRLLVAWTLWAVALAVRAGNPCSEGTLRLAVKVQAEAFESVSTAAADAGRAPGKGGQRRARSGARNALHSRFMPPTRSNAQAYAALEAAGLRVATAVRGASLLAVVPASCPRARAFPAFGPLGGGADGWHLDGLTRRALSTPGVVAAWPDGQWQRADDAAAHAHGADAGTGAPKVLRRGPVARLAASAPRLARRLARRAATAAAAFAADNSRRRRLLLSEPGAGPEAGAAPPPNGSGCPPEPPPGGHDLATSEVVPYHVEQLGAAAAAAAAPRAGEGRVLFCVLDSGVVWGGGRGGWRSGAGGERATVRQRPPRP
jgi:hypothetical protein